MKTLYIVRHAKSSWNQNNVIDFNRSLNERGRKDVKEMGKRLRSRELKIDKILASSSKRTSSTAFGLNKVFGLDSKQIEFRSDLYHSGVQVLLHQVCNTHDDCQELMLIAHNPGVSEFCDYLSDVEFYFPTLAIAKVTFEAGSWREISKGTGTVEWYDFPKNTLNS